MKSEFSKSWVSSKQPRKQVKFRANAPNHIKRKFMGALLDKPLREKYGMRNVEVRKGDDVKIMRGKFAKKQGKVGVVDVKNTRIQVDGVQRAKSGGEKLETWFHPSNVKIILLDTTDNRRFKSSKKKTSEGNVVKDKPSEDKEKKSLENKTVKKLVSKKPVEEKK